MRDRIIQAIKDFFDPYWRHLTRNVYRDAWLNGMDNGYREAHRDIYELLLDKRSDVVAVKDSAKDNTTKAGGDGMVIGYELAVSALREEIKELKYIEDLNSETEWERREDRTPF